MQNIIKKILLTTGVSKTQFSKDLGISKSFVLNVINGTKKCSRSMYEKLRTLSYIPSTMKDELEEAFYSSSFGEDNYSLVKHYISLLERTEKDFSESSKMYVRKDFLEEILSAKDKIRTINNKSELFEFAVFFAEKCTGADDSFFYTNYSFSQIELDKLLFTVFRDRDYSKSIDFKHLVTINNTATIETLDVFYNSIKWGRILLDTKYTKSYYENTTQLFPYYVITPFGIIMFDDSCEKGIVLSSESTIDYYKMTFLETQQEMPNVCTVVIDEVACLGQTDLFSGMNTSLVSYGGLACLGPYCDEELLNNIAHDFPERVIMTKMFLAHYQALFLAPHKEYLCEDSYWNFVNDGDIHCVTEKYVGKCSHSDRAKLLSHIIEGNNKEDASTIRLLDDSKIKMPLNIVVDCLEDHSVITSLFLNEPCLNFTKPYCITIVINHTDMYWFKELSENLCEYFEEKKLALTNDACTHAFERMIAKCKGEMTM